MKSEMEKMCVRWDYFGGEQEVDVGVCGHHVALI